jgi:hypothetical protein
MTREATLRLEDFIQAVQSQLDNAQAAMAVKARNLNLPLTFAIKDINLDLRAHVEFADSEIRIRPAGPGEKEASVFHLVFTAITRPAIEENAISFAQDDPDDQSLDELGDDLTSDERKRLEWAGVRTVKQFQEAQERGSVHTIGRVTNLPVERLRKALERASAPLVQRVEPVAPSAESGGDLPLMRVTGRNLVRGGVFPQVKIGDRPVSVLRSAPNELLLAPGEGQWAGELSIESAPTMATAMAFDLTAFAPAPAPAAEPPVPETLAAAPVASMGIAPAPVETRQ